MAKIKKPAVKAAAAKKSTAKKPAAKKPAAKKLAAKPTAKKPAAKPVAKKPAAKPAAKTVVKKPVAKPAAKPVAKKPAAKPAAKPAVNKPAAKSATGKAVVKPVAKPVVASDAVVKCRNLFDAAAQGKLPLAQGYIISSFFNEKNAYSIYEIVSYAGVKEIFPSDTGLRFVAGGKKLYVLVEHDTYEKKFLDPLNRGQGESIPKRFNEVETIIARNQTRIMVSKEPDELTSSFTIIKPTSINFAVIFYDLPDLFSNIANFFEESLNRQRKVPQSDAKKAAQLITTTLEKTMSFKGEFQ
jgi:hypothetical protein